MGSRDGGDGVRRARALAERLAADIATASRLAGATVTIDGVAALGRRDAVALEPPGLWSANRSCRLVRAVDGWIAVNLARPADVELVPAWLACSFGGDPWRAVITRARGRRVADLMSQARLLGLPVSQVGESLPGLPTRSRMSPRRKRTSLRVIDLSTLWAGPLCASVLALAGAEVIKVESRARPDTTRASAAVLDARLNALKQRVTLDFAAPAGRETLAALLADADVVVSSARRRAFAQLDIAPEAVFAANPGLVWVAISGYGWGEGADRVAFGDDAAAAGGLVRWTPRGNPRFVGDALADPLTGLAAAAAAFDALARGGGFLVDAAMAPVAAMAA